jgi:2-iminobutanoate/2-iminopropanoate deaminase
MSQTIKQETLFSEATLFSQGVQAGEFTFVAQDARGPDGKVGTAQSAEQQTVQSLLNLDTALDTFGQSTADVVSLSVYIADYRDAAAVANTLRDRFGNTAPAVNFVGVCALEGGCSLRVDAIATTSEDRETIRIADLPLSIGAGCHGVRVGKFYFLSGVDAADGNGRITAAQSIQMQTTEVLTRIDKILGRQQLGLGNLCRTFMFMPGTKHRPGYGEARKKVYQGIFAEDAFPPNSGIYIRSLGDNILLRSMAIAYRGEQKIVTSPKVRLAPGSFSQSVRVGDWLLLAGQDAVTFDRVVECEGSLAGQTEATLRHTKDIVEAAGGTVDDIVKATIYLTEGTDREQFAEAYRMFFAAHSHNGIMPTGLTVVVAELSPRCLVEIDSVAFLGRQQDTPKNSETLSN